MTFNGKQLVYHSTVNRMLMYDLFRLGHDARLR